MALLTQEALGLQTIGTPRHSVFWHRGRALGMNNQSKVVSDPQHQTAPDRSQLSWLASTSQPGVDPQIFRKEGQLDRAVDALLLMEQEGSVPSITMYRSVLKACAARKALAQAKLVYAHLAKHGLESNKFLGEYVVSTMVKCGGLGDAMKVFHRLPKRTVFSWTAVIAGHTTCGQCEEALKVYQCMQEQGVAPNAFTLVSLLKACGNMADLKEGKRIHSEVLKYGLEMELFVGNTLVDMYGKCGSIVDAHEVFARLTQRDVVSWNVMLAAFVLHGQAEEALQLYERMGKEGVSADTRTFVSVLQACGMLAGADDHGVANGLSSKIRALNLGRKLHAETQRKGYSSHLFVASSLISMFGKCGSIVEAQVVFDELSQRDVVVWTALINVYVEQGQGEKSLRLYAQMCAEGASPNSGTVVSALQACGMLAEKEDHGGKDVQASKCKALEMGKAIHTYARKKGFNSDVSVSNTLISMYGKCGNIVEAQRVFDGLATSDVVSWNAMLAAYVEHSQADKAFQLYRQMQKQGPSPDTWTFVSILQACNMLAEQGKDAVVDGRPVMVTSLEQGRAIHADITRNSSNLDVFVGNGLISMYGKCGSIADAQKVFGELSKCDVVSWNTMLALYVGQGEAEATLHLYDRMLQEGVCPDDRTFVSALQACGMLAEKEEDVLVDGQFLKIACLEMGKTIQADVQKHGHGADMFVCNTLVSMYGKCGSIVDAKNSFDGLPQRGVVSWNAMLVAYLEQHQAEKALQLYEQMQGEGVSPNERTCLSILQVCSRFAEEEYHLILDGQSLKGQSLEMGKTIHSYAHKKGYDLDVLISNHLINHYGKCGSILDAQTVFSEMPHRDVGSWNAMLVTYVKHDQAQKACELFDKMRESGASPDKGSFAIAFQACCILADKEAAVTVDWHLTKEKTLKRVKRMHNDARDKNYDSDVFIGSSLVTVYGKCGSIADAQSLFDRLSHADVVAWTALIAVYVELGQAEKALQMYGQMREAGVSPDEITITWVMQACSLTGSLVMLRQMHHSLVRAGHALSPPLASTLISAYSRCSSMVDAQSAFEALLDADLVSWNALLSGYARQGDYAAIMRCFEKQLRAGVKPDGVTFLSLLSGCSHAGLVDKGVECFESMSRDYDLTPGVEHYVRLVDLLGRAGWFDRIEEVLSSMPMQPSLSIWLCLLGACRKHGRITLAEQAFERAVLLEPKHSASYVLMSTIYFDAGLLDRAKAVIESRQEACAWKEAGQSWMEHQQEVQTFLAGECKLPQHHNIRGLLKKVRSELRKEVFVAAPVAASTHPSPPEQTD